MANFGGDHLEEIIETTLPTTKESLPISIHAIFLYCNDNYNVVATDQQKKKKKFPRRLTFRWSREFVIEIRDSVAKKLGNRELVAVYLWNRVERSYVEISGNLLIRFNERDP